MTTAWVLAIAAVILAGYMWFHLDSDPWAAFFAACAAFVTGMLSWIVSGRQR